MCNLSISEADLDRRRKKLPQRLKPLTSDVSYIQASFQTIGTHFKAIAVHRGQRSPLSYSEWRVSLKNSNISLSYFEIWQSSMASGGLACFVLQKAYLHIYLPKPSGVDQKLLLVHCDPQESKDSIHYRYKIAPHLHFEMAPCPWNETHIPLCDGWQETILQSLDNLDKAIARAIEFIADELLPLSRTTY